MGSEEFRERMLGFMEKGLKPVHSGELRQESAQARAERIVREELRRLGCTEQEFAFRRCAARFDPYGG